MASTQNTRDNRNLVLALTRQLQRQDGGDYAWPAYARPMIESRVHAAAQGPRAVADVGALLKLVAVLRSKHCSPAAAKMLTDILQSDRFARRIIALHWSGGGQRPRVGPDLMPVKTGPAPHINARPNDHSLRASTFLRAGADLRSAHLHNKTMRNKS